MCFSAIVARLPLLRLFLIGVALLLVVLPSRGARAQELKKAVILPQWEPQAQFAGIYMAEATGIYARHGVDMTVLRGGPERPPHVLLASGEADFATMFLTTAVKLASQGEELVNLAQIVRRSSLMLVAKKARGILKPADLRGGCISSWGPEFFIQVGGFLRRHRINVGIVQQGYSVDLFLRDAVDAVSAMWYNEYHTILNSGLDPEDLTVFAMSDYGLDYPEDGLYCTRATLERDPELCCAVAKATLEGWRHAFEHPEETLDKVMEHVEQAKLPTNRVHQRWMLARMRDIIAPEGGATMGPLSREEYLSVAKAMVEAELIGSFPPYEEFHALCPETP